MALRAASKGRDWNCPFQGRHVAFESHDLNDGRPSGVSIPLAKALDAAIRETARGAVLGVGACRVRGCAVAGDRTVIRVDVLGDGGRTWIQATREPEPDAPFAWTFRTAELDPLSGEHDRAVRTWDSAGRIQPALPDDVWNHKGYLSTCWHRVRVTRPTEAPACVGLIDRAIVEPAAPDCPAGPSRP